MFAEWVKLQGFGKVAHFVYAYPLNPDYVETRCGHTYSKRMVRSPLGFVKCQKCLRLSQGKEGVE